MTYNTSPYKAQRALGRYAHEFYGVACPYCGAGVGRGCFQKSLVDRTGQVRYIGPHGVRIRLILARETK